MIKKLIVSMLLALSLQASAQPAEEIKPGVYQVREDEFLITGQILFDLDTYKNFIELLLAAQKGDVLYVHIDSNGGSVFTALAISDAMYKSKARIITVVHVARSAATTIATSGTDIYLEPSSRFMVHQMREYDFKKQTYRSYDRIKEADVYDFMRSENKWKFSNLHFSDDVVLQLTTMVVDLDAEIEFGGQAICDLSSRAIKRVTGCLISMR